MLTKPAFFQQALFMIPDRCSFCKGKLREGKTEFLARAAGEVIVIKDVPAYVCDQCGEAYYTAEISRKIDGVMQSAHQKKLCMRPLPAGEVSLNG
jgi:YgiT-type zinc finger domain-containing protein